MLVARGDVIAVGLGSRVRPTGRLIPKTSATWASGTPWPRWRGRRTGGASRWAARAAGSRITTSAAASWSTPANGVTAGAWAAWTGAATSSAIPARGPGRGLSRRARLAAHRRWRGGKLRAGSFWVPLVSRRRPAGDGRQPVLNPPSSRTMAWLCVSLLDLGQHGRTRLTD